MGISKTKRKDSGFIMLYKGLEDAPCIPRNDRVSPSRRTKKQSFPAIQIPLAGNDIYKWRFLPRLLEIGQIVYFMPRAIRNSLTDSQSNLNDILKSISQSQSSFQTTDI